MMCGLAIVPLPARAGVPSAVSPVAYPVHSERPLLSIGQPEPGVPGQYPVAITFLVSMYRTVVLRAASILRRDAGETTSIGSELLEVCVTFWSDLFCAMFVSSAPFLTMSGLASVFFIIMDSCLGGATPVFMPVNDFGLYQKIARYSTTNTIQSLLSLPAPLFC